MLTRGRARGYVIRRDVTGANRQPLNSAAQNNAVIVVDGNKEQYLAGLRQVRDAARGVERANGREIRADATRRTRRYWNCHRLAVNLPARANPIDLPYTTRPIRIPKQIPELTDDLQHAIGFHHKLWPACVQGVCFSAPHSGGSKM